MLVDQVPSSSIIIRLPTVTFRAFVDYNFGVVNSAPLYQMLSWRTVFVHRCNSHGTGAIRSDYERASLGRSRELLRITRPGSENDTAAAQHYVTT